MYISKKQKMAIAGIASLAALGGYIFVTRVPTNIFVTHGSQSPDGQPLTYMVPEGSANTVLSMENMRIVTG